MAAILAGCSSYGGHSSKSNVSEADYKVAHSAATKSLKLAKSANNIWRDSEKILKKAESAAKKGDFTTANKLAMVAKRQGELALAQAKQQVGAGPL
jgi:predicted S18 family serine protease